MDESIQYPRFRWLVLATTCLGVVAAQLNVIAYAPLLGDIAKDLRVDMAAAIYLLTVVLITSHIAVFVGGFLCDRYGIMLVIILGLLCASVPAALMPWIGTSYKAVIWARVIQGVSVGFLFAAIAPIFVVWFPPQERGRATGLMNGSFSQGAAVGVLGAPAVFFSVRSWQQMVAWLSIPGWVALVVSIVAVVSPKPQLPSQSQPSGTPVTDGTAFKQALSAPITWVGVLVTFFVSWCLQSLYNLTPTYFATDKPMGISFGPMLSGKLMFAAMIAGMFGPVIAGMLTDKVFRGNGKPVLQIGFALTCVFTYAILSPVVYTNMPVLVGCLILAGMGAGFLYPDLLIFLSLIYPTQIVGKMAGVWTGIGGFGSSIALFVSGLLVAKFGNYSAAITLLALAAVFGSPLRFSW